jgi:hypothetical protein
MSWLKRAAPFLWLTLLMVGLVGGIAWVEPPTPPCVANDNIGPYMQTCGFPGHQTVQVCEPDRSRCSSPVSVEQFNNMSPEQRRAITERRTSNNLSR